MRITRKQFFPAVTVLLVGFALGAATIASDELWRFLRTGHFQTRSVGDVLREYGPTMEARLKPLAQRSGISWPPARVQLLAFKQEQRLEVWVGATTGPLRPLCTYAVTNTSGRLGPKRMEGDRQIPEGDYTIVGLNPNSRFHLSLKVGYPNAYDIAHSRVPRQRMGGDIFIHGGSATIGCLPIGDDAIEELFCLVAQTPPAGRRILIAPLDFRAHPNFSLRDEEEWVKELYRDLERKLNQFPRPAAAFK